MLEIRQTSRYRAWFEALRDRQAKARIVARVRRLQEGNPGQHRQLAGGVLELKIDFGPGYRVYCTQRGGQFILLLVGGDKSSQTDDIATAQAMAKEI
jgi:putative addiction module killer protein